MRALLAALLVAFALPAQAQIVIAHRGASGERPEHTLAAYDRAIDQGADYLEIDLVPTKDGVLVARHEPELGETTDVAQRPEFADRKTTRQIDGKAVEGWFADDFTLAELRQLRARERIATIRPANARFDGLFQVPTLAEIARLARARESGRRRVGLYIELKHPAHFAGRGTDVVAMLVRELEGLGLAGSAQPVILQCFEVGPLVRLREKGWAKLVQLIDASEGPADRPGLAPAAMASADGFRDVALYADGVGLDADLFDADPARAARIIGEAKAAGLAVHVWTLRRENRFLPPAFRRGPDAETPGDMAGAVRALTAAGADGIITDNPAEVPRGR